MGGNGSTRWANHQRATAVSECIRVQAPKRLEHGTGYSVRCSSQERPIGTAQVVCVRRDDGLWAALSFTPDDDWLGQRRAFALAQVVSLLHGGMTQHYFRCPAEIDGAPCRKLVRALYLPVGAARWACRHCHRLTYASRREHDKGMDALKGLDPEEMAALLERIADLDASTLCRLLTLHGGERWHRP